MAGFGEKLRRERELRGISLDQIATATKISTRMLKALEDEKFDLLPGGIFNKGFIRSYAKFLGIDEEQAVADYVAATGPEEPINNLPQIADVPERPARQLDEEGTISWTTIVVLVLLVAIGYGGWTYHNHRKAEKESSTATAPVAAISTPPVETPPADQKLQTAKVTQPKPLESTPAKGAPPSTVSPAALKTDATEPAHQTLRRLGHPHQRRILGAGRCRRKDYLFRNASRRFRETRHCFTTDHTHCRQRRRSRSNLQRRHTARHWRSR